jgi:hypothetical protein
MDLFAKEQAMKTMRRLLGGLLIAGVATSAQAIPIQFIDTYTPNPA